MANDLTFNQISSVLNEITEQATGKRSIAPANTAEFVTVAQTALLAGYDNLIGAISQVLAKTIFANRPYTRKFKDLEFSNMEWGNHVRKINIGDKPFTNDSRMPLADGSSVDMYTLDMPKIVQTNFYGQETYQRSYPLFKDQLDVAFQNPEEFASFVSLVVQNCSDLIEQAHETLARDTLVNLIAGIIDDGEPEQVVHLLTEYNAATELSLTAKTVYQPANFPAFMRWAYARINTISALLTERSYIFHKNITGKEIARHTPKDMQRVYLYAPTQYNMEANVLSETFHDEYLKDVKGETVNFWQSIKTPGTINAIPSYMDRTGTAVTAEEAVEQSNIFGIITDRDAIGYNVFNQWSAPTPFNSKGGYSVVWYHFTDRYFVDHTENSVLFLLD